MREYHATSDTIIRLMVLMSITLPSLDYLMIPATIFILVIFVPIVTQIQRLVVYIRKDVGALLRLSRHWALASPRQG